MEPVAIEVGDEIAKLKGRLAELERVTGTTPAPEPPKELALEERRKLVAQLNKIRDQYEKDTAQVKAAIKKAEATEADLRARLEAASKDVLRKNYELADCGSLERDASAPIVEALKRGKPKVIGDILARIGSEIAAAQQDMLGVGNEAGTARLAIGQARVRQLMDLHGTVEFTWFRLGDSDAEMWERLKRELAKLPTNQPKPKSWMGITLPTFSS